MGASGDMATNPATALATNLAIIPARGGSRRIPRKNIKLFAGQPMLSYALRAAQQSGLFAHIVVSTDDDEIAIIAQQFGARTAGRRPPHLADDHAGVIPVLQHTIAQCHDLGWAFDDVCCIYPCVPLLQSGDIVRAHAQMQAAQADFAFAVCEFPSAIQRALRANRDGSMQAFFPEHTATRSQDLEPAYFDVGQFYWGKPEAWLAGRSPHHGGQACLIPAERAVDIDTPHDWRRAELMYAALAAIAPGEA